MNDYSDFLFARPSFFEGFSRVLDLGSTINVYNQARDGDEADTIALTMDTYAIGDDFVAVLNEATCVDAKE